MTPAREDDWSDSDGDDLSDVETSVLLGLPDGAIENVVDITDAAVSRIGGQPAFIPSKEPPFSSSCCKNCSNPSELLVQIWCPFEDSPMDRALYIWGCARGGCQGKEGSFRAWRGLRLNHEYAAKLAQKLAKKRQRAKNLADAEAAKKKQLSMCNPFSMQDASAPGAFGLGSVIFSGDTPAPGLVAQPLEEDRELSDNESEQSISSDDGSSLITAMASATIGSEWKSAPSYTAFYLSTASEYLPPPYKGKLPPEVQDEPEDNRKEHKDASWAFEAYENSLKIDHVFERFTKRVSHEAEQCVRYELNGTPLPFGSDKVFDMIFPAPSTSLLPVTGHDIKVRTTKRTYDASSIPPCPICKSKRVFEVQLMPNLINILTKPGEKRQKVMTDKERTVAVEEALVRGDGMEWGTCMVFSCEKDCCEVGDCWREEVVLVQWDA